MRTLEEIKKDLKNANETSNAESMRSLADEAESHGTVGSLAQAERARGIAFRLKGDYVLAIEQFEKALAHFGEVGDNNGIASASAQIGVVHYSVGENQQAVEKLEYALSLFEEGGDLYEVAGVVGNLGIASFYVGDYPGALQRFEQALSMNEDLGLKSGSARIHGNIGTLYSATGDFPRAIKSYERALALSADEGDMAVVSNSTGNIGNVYKSLGDHERALEFLKRALNLHEELGDNAGVARVSESLCSVYGSMGDFGQAHEFGKRAVSLYQEQGNQLGTAHAMGVVIGVLIDQGDYEVAERMLEEQSSMLSDFPDTRAGHHFHKAKVYENKEDFESALTELQASLSIVEGIGNRQGAAEVQKRLRDLAQKRNDFAAYIEHNTEYTRINEEIRGKEATQKVAMMDAERKVSAELQQRDKERALLFGTLPESVANRILRGEDVSGDHYDHAAVIFLDIVGFTMLSEQMPSGQVVSLLDEIFTTLDAVCEEHDITKIKTIGDSYLAVSFEDEEHPEASARGARAAIGMRSAIEALKSATLSEVDQIQVRIGLHSGPVTAGVIGTQRMQYDVWGDTVNVASRMESSGEPGRIQVSEVFAGSSALRAKDDSDYVRSSAQGAKDDSIAFVERGEIEIKGKGSMKTFWLEGA